MPPQSKFNLKTVAVLLLLTVAALLISGYHVGIEDQEVYLAAVKKNLDPSLYPFNAQFFMEQMKIAVFIPAVAWSVRLTHLPIDWVMFLWHIGSLLLILGGCWRLASLCFESDRGRWASVTAVAVLMTTPIAGTALYMVDQYLHPRALATGAILFALAAALQRRWISTVVWLVLSTLMHPLMAAFGISLVVFTTVPWPAKSQMSKSAAMMLMLPIGLFEKPSEAWKEATLARTYYFPLRWEWYEWLGLIGPVLLLFWFRHVARRRGMGILERLTTRVLVFAAFQFAVGAVMTMPKTTQMLASLQPMRWLHVFYFVFVIIAGGLAGEFVLKASVWRWVVVFVPLAAVMFFAQRDLFEYSSHIDWPGAQLKNKWAQAFLWARANTPKDARFAIDPDYMGLRGEDNYGFRGLAERSLMAENQKDPGEATVFPALAPLWKQQVDAQRGIEKFGRAQFIGLYEQFGVTHVVLPGSAKVELKCPYKNEYAQVCEVR